MGIEEGTARLGRMEGSCGVAWYGCSVLVKRRLVKG